MNRIVVIGGGASGMMAAIMAARCGAQVTVLEHNERTGKKLGATGNGRCNLTNERQEPSFYRGTDPEFAWKVISCFTKEDTKRFFSELGILPKSRSGWLYPYSDQAASVCEVLEMEARHCKVKIKTKEEVLSVQKENQHFSVKTTTWQYECEKVIICTGSPASPVEGSSDTGYRLARSFGHSVIEPLPALVALRGKGNYFSSWAGCRMEGTVTCKTEKEALGVERGEILFTEYGISGIAVFQNSRYVIRSLHQQEKVSCYLDLFPDFTKEEFLKLLQDRKNACPYKNAAELLVGLMPKKMIPVFAKPKDSLEEITDRLKNWKLPIGGAHSLKQAQICSGGVAVRELTDQLESRLQKGIYFAGEVVDVDGPCGGYNLQWAWSSGAVAGAAAARE